MARPTTIIHRWPQVDERVVPASPICTDDGDTSWFAGIQRCFVGVAIAGAAAALATSTAIARSFDEPDERVVPASFAPDDDSAGLPQAYPGSATYIVWATDEVIVPQPAGPPEEAGWLPPAPRQPAPVFQVWQDGDAFTSFQLAEDDWQQLLPRLAAPVLPQPWEDQTDERVPQPNPIAEEDYWHRLYWVPALPDLKQWGQQPDEIEQAVAPLQIDEMHWQPVAILIAQVPEAITADDEIVPQAALALDEGEWLPWAMRVVPRPQQPAGGEDEVVQQPAPIAYEDYWPRFFSVTVAPKTDVCMQQDEVATVVIETYTADSLTRIGPKRDRVPGWRIGKRVDGRTQ